MTRTHVAVAALLLALVSCASEFSGERPADLSIFGECPDGSHEWVHASRRITIVDVTRGPAGVVLSTGPDFCGDVTARTHGRMASLEPRICNPDVPVDQSRRLTGGVIALVDTESQSPQIVVNGRMERDVTVPGFPALTCQLHFVGVMAPGP